MCSRRVRRVLAVVAVVALVMAVSAAGYGTYMVVHARRTTPLPAPGGDFGVGRTLTQWTDATRDDPFAPPATTATGRTLAVVVWYPAKPGTGGARYMPGKWAGLHLPSPVGVGQTSFGRVVTHASDEATPATGRFPLVVLEPGLGLAALQYTALGEALASHGYVVVAPTPTYSANLSVIDDHVVSASAAGNPTALNATDLHTGAAQEAGDRLVAVWAADALFAASSARAADGPPFNGHLAEPTYYVGHSLGGAASLQACSTDRGCAGAVDLDGTQFGDVVDAGLHHPYLIVAAGAGCVTGTCTAAGAADQSDVRAATRLQGASDGPWWAFTIEGARHFNFTDYDAYYLAQPLRLLIPVGSLPRGRVLQVSDAAVLAFLEHTRDGGQQLGELAGRYPELTAVHSPG